MRIVPRKNADTVLLYILHSTGPVQNSNRHWMTMSKKVKNGQNIRNCQKIIRKWSKRGSKMRKKGPNICYDAKMGKTGLLNQLTKWLRNGIKSARNSL